MFKELIRLPLPNFISKVLGISTFTIYSYACCVVLGAIISCVFIRKLAKKELPHTTLSWSFFYQLFIAGYLGGKLFFYLEQPAYYFLHPSNMLHAVSGGFVCYGSVIAVSIYTLYYCKKHSIAPLVLLDILSLASTIAIAFGRLGCFLNGCCYGKETSLPIGMVFRNSTSQAVHPTQLYEVGLMIFIWFVLFRANKNKQWQGQLFMLNLTIYAIGRSIIELWRGDVRGFLLNGNLSHAQGIALIALFISGMLHFKLRKQQILSPLNKK